MTLVQLRVRNAKQFHKYIQTLAPSEKPLVFKGELMIGKAYHIVETTCGTSAIIVNPYKVLDENENFIHSVFVDRKLALHPENLLRLQLTHRQLDHFRKHFL